ncbi:hypothetical protein [Ancylobacter moscoviensis]
MAVLMIVLMSVIVRMGIAVGVVMIVMAAAAGGWSLLLPRCGCLRWLLRGCLRRSGRVPAAA